MELGSVEVAVAVVIVILTITFIAYRLIFTAQPTLPAQKKPLT